MADTSWLIPVALIIGGFITAFVGKKLLKAIVMIVAGGVLAFALYWLSTHYLSVEPVTTAIIVLMGFIVGAFLGWFLVKLAIALAIGFIAGIVIASALGLGLVALVLVILLSIGIAYVLAEKIIEAAMAVLGSIMIYYGIVLATQPSLIWRNVAIGVSLVVFVLALYYTHRSK